MNKGTLGLPHGLGNLLGFEQVSTASLEGGGPVLNLSVPQDFTHLMLLGSLRSTRSANSDQPSLRFNGDTANTYDRQTVAGFGATNVAAATGSTSAQLTASPAANMAAGYFGPLLLLVPFYRANDRYKHALSYTWSKGDDFGGITAIGWQSLEPVRHIEIYMANGDFAAGSCATLYGIT